MYFFSNPFQMIGAIICALILVYLGMKISKASPFFGKIFYILAAVVIGGFIAKMFFAALMWMLGWLVALIVIVFICYELFKTKSDSE